eukprot:scaffold123440_cov33-Phaeocystis_antarctica.AAC.1
MAQLDGCGTQPAARLGSPARRHGGDALARQRRRSFDSGGHGSQPAAQLDGGGTQPTARLGSPTRRHGGDARALQRRSSLNSGGS